MGKSFKRNEDDSFKFQKANKNWKKFHPKKDKLNNIKPYKEIDKDPDFTFRDDKNDDPVK